MSTEEPRIEIVESGSQFELMAQPFDWGRVYRERKTFKLVLENRSTSHRVIVYVYVKGINEHTGSDTAYNINGIIANRTQNAYAELWRGNDSWLENLEKFEAHLDTRTRKGTIWKRKF